jgi:hypothetical protein
VVCVKYYRVRLCSMWGCGCFVCVYVYIFGGGTAGRFEFPLYIVLMASC